MVDCNIQIVDADVKMQDKAAFYYCTAVEIRQPTNRVFYA